MYFGVNNISVSYSKRQALDNINHSFSKGKITAIIGKNGSGKSTLLRSLANLTKYKGEVILQDQNLRDVPASERAKKIAFLPQQTSLMADMTVFDLISLGRFPHQKMTQQSLSSEDREVVESVLEDLKLWDLRDEKLSSLSGGQRQRAWVGIVLAQETEILLLDEPTTYLDMSMQLEILTFLKDEVAKKGKTLICVLHDLNLVSSFADELVVLKEGRLVATGTSEELFTEQMIKEAFSLEAVLGQDAFSDKKMITGIRNV